MRMNNKKRKLFTTIMIIILTIAMIAPTIALALGGG